MRVETNPFAFTFEIISSIAYYTMQIPSAMTKKKLKLKERMLNTYTNSRSLMLEIHLTRPFESLFFKFSISINVIPQFMFIITIIIISLTIYAKVVLRIFIAKFVQVYVCVCRVDKCISYKCITEWEYT